MILGFSPCRYMARAKRFIPAPVYIGLGNGVSSQRVEERAFRPVLVLPMNWALAPVRLQYFLISYSF